MQDVGVFCISRHKCPNVSWRKAIHVTVGWFAGRT